MSEQKIVIANCLDHLRTMPDACIDMCITSPPYWALRDYGTEPVVWGKGCDRHTFDEDGYCTCGAWKGQLGLEPSPNEYVDHLIMVFDEVKRVLKPTGACWVNIGDTYATTSGFVGDTKGIARSLDSILSAKKVREGLDRTEFPQKTLCQIPSRFALAMTGHGWILRNECIWRKVNVMPTPTKDRFTVDFEKFFFFTKNSQYYFKQQFEPVQKSQTFPQRSVPLFDEDGDAYGCDAEGRNCRATWDIPTKGNHNNHVAMFPKELIKRPIDACCPKGGTVLDPFCGSGTVLEYCWEKDIDAIGIEINPDYEEIIKKRANHGQSRLYDHF